MHHNDNDDVSGQPPQDDSTMKLEPRAYQIEMLEESLKRNIIVAVSFLFRLFL
jgi:hypothetical protein